MDRRGTFWTPSHLVASRSGRHPRPAMSNAAAQSMINAAAEPTAPSPQAQTFYAEALRELSRLGLPFLVAGTYAVSAYTGNSRSTKDLDIFCKQAIAHAFSRIFRILVIASPWQT